MQPRPRVYYGWYIAWSYFFMNFYWGGALLAGFSALFLPISESFGLSALLVTTAISLRHGRRSWPPRWWDTYSTAVAPGCSW